MLRQYSHTWVVGSIDQMVGMWWENTFSIIVFPGQQLKEGRESKGERSQLSCCLSFGGKTWLLLTPTGSKPIQPTRELHDNFLLSPQTTVWNLFSLSNTTRHVRGVGQCLLRRLECFQSRQQKPRVHLKA